jgi:cellulose synthase/poly-beta-1,6-N-acetylglucosamine synthase-like glycosyltransferase
MVQVRWEHLNKNYNLLTRLFSIGLDGHFRIEQKARNSNGKFMNFNGTAGMWRKSCIEDAGGWSADTLTEDFDLSYRAQLKGWKMKYLEEYAAPAEIPAFIQAIRSQQYRWNKGGAEIARKNFKTLCKADLPFHVKVHALFHVLNTGVFLAIFLAAILSFPLLVYLASATFNQDFLMYTWLFLLGFLIIAGFYWVTIRQRGESDMKTTLQFMLYFPFFLSLSMGLSLFNAIAVTEGYLGIRSPFIRTPKFNIVGEKGDAIGNRYLKSKIPFIAIIEGILACYFVFAIYIGVQLEYHPFIPFHFLLALGFGGIAFYSVKHSFIRV